MTLRKDDDASEIYSELAAIRAFCISIDLNRCKIHGAFKTTKRLSRRFEMDQT